MVSSESSGIAFKFRRRCLRRGARTSSSETRETGYSYQYRSYGLGSSVGIANSDMVDQPPSYRFYETGLQANAICIYNLTSAFSLKQAPVEPQGWTIGMYYANGTLPNSQPGNISYYITLGHPGPWSVALAGRYSQKLGYVALATTAQPSDKYGGLNRAQCRPDFVSQNFSITVNVTSHTISANPLDEIPWPVYADILLDSVMYGFERLGLTLNGHFDFSILDDTFTTNMAQAQRA